MGGRNLAKILHPGVALSGQQTLVELHASRTNEVCTMYIEEFILVDIWIHCCASWSYCTVHGTGVN